LREAVRYSSPFSGYDAGVVDGSHANQSAQQRPFRGLVAVDTRRRLASKTA
jgi:hypothetical protein